IRNLATKRYIITSRSFTKKEYTPSERQTNLKGEPIIWTWGPERLQNEASALAFIRERTTIPVPRVLYCGKDSDGAMCLEVEYIHGITCDDIGETCRMPQAHDSAGKCLECEKIAFGNTNKFIESEVIPQLRSLTSKQTGLNGVVIPPPRIQEFDGRTTWLPIRSPPGREYVFCHGDLTRSNIILDPETLTVKSIIDWETAGFLPENLELPLWRLDYAQYMDTFRDHAEIEQSIRLLTAED
ncbi:hypothetical protein LY78DRAFT_731585, partial [Colletotrichum sublineola]